MEEQRTLKQIIDARDTLIDPGQKTGLNLLDEGFCLEAEGINCIVEDLVCEFYDEDFIARGVSRGDKSYEERLSGLIDYPVDFLERPAGPIIYPEKDEKIRDIVESINSVGLRNLNPEKYTSEGRRKEDFKTKGGYLRQGNILAGACLGGAVMFESLFNLWDIPSQDPVHWLNLSCFGGISLFGYAVSRIFGERDIKKNFDRDLNGLRIAAQDAGEYLQQEDIKYRD